MNCSTPGLPVYHQLPEFTQTHVHRVSDPIQPFSSSVVPFSSCPQSLPASESFPMSQLFAWGGQIIGVSALASVLPWTPRTDLLWNRLAVQGTLKSLLQHHYSKASILHHSAFFTAQLSHPYMTTGKTIVLTRWTSGFRKKKKNVSFWLFSVFFFFLIMNKWGFMATCSLKF